MDLQELFSIALPITLTSILIITLTNHYRNVYSFWPKHGIKGYQPLVPYLNDILDRIVRNPMKSSIERRNKFGKIYGYFFMNKPRLHIYDAEVVKQIAVKDFDLFPNHTVMENADKYMLNSLIWIKDEHWRRHRAMMTPTFTSAKIRCMFKLMDGCADDLVENFREQYVQARRAGESSALVDLVSTFGMYTMDAITTCCYGIKLKRQQQTPKTKRLKHRSAVSARDSLVEEVAASNIKLHRILMFMFVPKFIVRLFNLTLRSEADVKPLANRVQKMIDSRRQGIPNKYDDLLQLLIDAKLDDKLELEELDQIENHHADLSKESLEQDHAKLHSDLEKVSKKKQSTLSDFEILSEAILMLGAGHETTRSSMSAIAYYLAHYPEVQERLYGELKKVAQYTPTALGKHLIFDYDSLTSCQYLDAVISEVLRMQPPAIYTDRYARQKYHIDKYNVTIPKGTQVLFGIYSIHMDPDYWHEPEKFDPERFMPGNREKIVPGAYLPFSLGPRHCIGMRFSLTETKLGLAKVVMNFKFEAAPGTRFPPVCKRSTGVGMIKNCRVKVCLRDDE